MRRLVLLVGVLCATALAACSRPDGYSQATPEDLIKTAKLMVERGRADQLTTLIYAENADWGRLLRRLGVMLGNLQTLGLTLHEAFPSEIADLNARAEAAAKKGQATGLLQQFTGSRNPLQRRSGARPSAAEQRRQQDAINAAIRRLFADPYAFLEEGSGRLTTVPVSDDIAAVLWDGQPVLPPVGLSMRRQVVKGKDTWYFVLPTNIPLLANYMPRNQDEFKVFGSLIATIDNVVVDLTRDVKEKRVTSLDDAAKRAGEKVLIPAAMVFYAYDRAVRSRNKPAPGKSGPG